MHDAVHLRDAVSAMRLCVIVWFECLVCGVCGVICWLLVFGMM